MSLIAGFRFELLQSQSSNVFYALNGFDTIDNTAPLFLGDIAKRQFGTNDLQSKVEGHSG
jgi:hypothetical protein